MIAISRADAPGKMGRIEAALRDRNGAALRESAHKLRGLVSAFTTTAAEAANLLEQAGAVGQLDDTPAAYASLLGMVGELGPLLDNLSVDDLKSRLNAANVLNHSWQIPEHRIKAGSTVFRPRLTAERSRAVGL